MANVAGLQVHGLNHAGFTVTDLEAALAFLTEGLGFTLISRALRPGDMAQRLTGVPGAKVEIAFVALDGFQLELIRFHQGGGEGGAIASPACPGSAHIALSVTDVAAVSELAQRHGARLLGDVVTIPAGPNMGGKVGYLHHPAGLLLELIARG